MTETQRDIIRHALGLNYAKKPYRNVFATAPDCDTYQDVFWLVQNGFMEQRNTIPGGLIYFFVTPAGEAEAGRLIDYENSNIDRTMEKNV